MKVVLYCNWKLKEKAVTDGRFDSEQPLSNLAQTERSDRVVMQIEQECNNEAASFVLYSFVFFCVIVIATRSRSI